MLVGDFLSGIAHRSRARSAVPAAAAMSCFWLTPPSRLESFELDVSRDHIDALVTSTAKGLLGIYGCGFLYCRGEWVERLTPAYLSRPAVELPPDRYSEMAGLDVDMRRDARRFEVGAVDYASCYAVDASLDLLRASARLQSKRKLWRSQPLTRRAGGAGARCAKPRVRSGSLSHRHGRAARGGWPRIHYRSAAGAPVGASDRRMASCTRSGAACFALPSICSIPTTTWTAFSHLRAMSYAAMVSEVTCRYNSLKITNNRGLCMKTFRLALAALALCAVAAPVRPGAIWHAEESARHEDLHDRAP